MFYSPPEDILERRPLLHFLAGVLHKEIIYKEEIRK